MKQPPDLALITDNGGFLSRAVCQEETRQCLLRDCSVTLLPLRCKRGENAIRNGLGAAQRAGCRVAALEPEQRRAIYTVPLQVADGRLLALCTAKRRLDTDCPGWTKDMLCFSADDNFSCLAARWLAPYSGSMHICGQDAARRQALTLLLYRESGLIATESRLPRPDSLLILPPLGSADAVSANGAFMWQAWPQTAINGQSEALPCHLAEGLLLAAGGLPAGIKPLQVLILLQHRASYNKILPI